MKNKHRAVVGLACAALCGFSATGDSAHADSSLGAAFSKAKAALAARPQRPAKALETPPAEPVLERLPAESLQRLQDIARETFRKRPTFGESTMKHTFYCDQDGHSLTVEFKREYDTNPDGDATDEVDSFLVDACIPPATGGCHRLLRIGKFLYMTISGNGRIDPLIRQSFKTGPDGNDAVAGRVSDPSLSALFRPELDFWAHAAPGTYCK